MSESKPRPKVTNAGRSVVRESLEGLVALNPGLRISENENCIFRYDYRQHAAAGKVCLISGGGAGHEPMVSGFVGTGMLTAAVAGSVFTSPPPKQILNSLRKLATATPLGAKHGGVLVLVYNYTGDRLNFGLAIERFRLEFGEERSIQMIVIGDDAATGELGAGRRGIAGGVFLLKIAGAMAEAGKSLQEIHNTLEYFKPTTLASMGASLGSVALPDCERFLFELPVGEIEIGLGVHGEAGITRMKITDCESIVASIGSKILELIEVQQGCRDVVLLVNNLGALSQLEMGVICKTSITFFEHQGLNVVRSYCGTLMTSLDMAGFSLTILKPTVETLHWLDAPTSSPFWFKPYTTKNCRERFDSPCLPSVATPVVSSRHGPSCNVDEAMQISKLTQKALDAIISAKRLLNDLDSGCGDGDCGTCLSKGADAIRQILEEKPNLFESPAEAFIELAVATENVMGGTSGAVYSLLFNGIASELFLFGSREIQFCQSLVAKCLNAGVLKVMNYGGAKKGDRTVVDVFLAVCDSLECQQSCVEILAAADNAAVKTATMKARVGRASYVNPRFTLGKEDAGARAAAIWIDAICKGACVYNETKL